MTDSVTERPYKIEFTYGPDNQRVKSVLKNNGTVVRTKYYSLGYEKDSTAAGARQLTYISSPYGLVAINIKDTNSDSTFIVETDHRFTEY